MAARCSGSCGRPMRSSTAPARARIRPSCAPCSTRSPRPGSRSPRSSRRRAPTRPVPHDLARLAAAVPELRVVPVSVLDEASLATFRDEAWRLTGLIRVYLRVERVASTTSRSRSIRRRRCATWRTPSTTSSGPRRPARGSGARPHGSTASASAATTRSRTGTWWRCCADEPIAGNWEIACRRPGSSAVARPDRSRTPGGPMQRDLVERAMGGDLRAFSTANPDGSNRAQLTADPRIDGFATFSRDGTRIAFQAPSGAELQAGLAGLGRRGGCGRRRRPSDRPRCDRPQPRGSR